MGGAEITRVSVNVATFSAQNKCTATSPVFELNSVLGSIRLWVCISQWPEGSHDFARTRDLPCDGNLDSASVRSAQ